MKTSNDHDGTQKNQRYNYNYIFRYKIYIVNYNNRWSRLEKESFRAGISLYIGRKRNSYINCLSSAYTANQSSEKVDEELIEHGYVVGRKGMTGLMKLSKVVVQNIYK